MSGYELTKTEKQRRKDLADQARKMIISKLNIQGQDETSVMTGYRGYYLQISFSQLHPLMVICLAKNLNHTGGVRQLNFINDLNLKSILGSHSINKKVGCYSYRATQWLDKELDSSRFYEILNRCVEEADRGYNRLTV